MAQLNDTMVQGDLRVTGKIYGTENAIRVGDANLAIPPLGNGDQVGSTGDFFVDSGSGKGLPNTTDNFNIHTTVTHFTGTTYRLSQIATPTSASNPAGIYERCASSSDGVTWTFGSWLAAANSSHTHGNIANGGTLQTNDITIANGDKLVVTDSSDSSKVARASISFDGSTTTQALTKAGTWATFNNYSHPAGSAPSKTGVPTANATPGFGGTFKVNQITTDATSHVSAVTERTITIPNATATTSADGLMSSADKTKLDGIAAGTASPLMDGKESVGNSLKYAREDHIHPTDANKLNADGSNATNEGVTAMMRKVPSGSDSLNDESSYFGDSTFDHARIVRRPVLDIWKYIKDKISSVLGLTATNYSGKAATAGTADKAVADNSGNNIVNTYATKTEVNAKQDRLSAGTGISISGNTVSTNLPLSNDKGATVKKDVWYIFAMANVTGGVWERCWDFLIASNHNSSAQMRLFISPRISAAGLIDSETLVQVDGHVTPLQLAKYKLATVKDSSGELYCCLCVNHSNSNENRTMQWNLRNARGISWRAESTPLSNYTVVSERLLSASMSSNRLVCFKQTNNDAVGNATQPVYVDAYGMIKACSSMPKFVIGTPAGAENTIYFT